LLPHKPVLEPFCQGTAELYYAPAAQTYQVVVTCLRCGLVVAAVATKLMLFHQAQLLEQPEATVNRG